ncbi:hypothetical protein DER45DRAFT_588282 [Fusarium avenaceum]|nr:hypothetical protein DER45DRAFT_588282 [Fusarium avenaceum]
MAVRYQSPALLWQHPSPKSTALYKFLQEVKATYNLDFDDYAGLHRWSIENVSDFWKEVWRFCKIKASKQYDQVLIKDAPMFPRPDFFAGARLNFAENLLFPEGIVDTDIACITVTEDGNSAQTTWSELRESVRQCSNALRASGVKPGDIIVGFVSNHVQSLVAMLAAATIGAIWTAISPENGVAAALDRFGQLEPAVLFVDDGMVYNEKKWSSLDKALEIVEKLKAKGLKLVVMITKINEDGIMDRLKSTGITTTEYEDFLKSSSDAPIDFEQLPSSHPLYILFSSGTTGLPKAIVHSALGTLIQNKKSHMLQCSMNQKSRIFYYTTTSWMMWHWSVAALACGSSVVLYTGSPFKPHGYLSIPKLLEKYQVTHFGTSAAYLTTLEAHDVCVKQEVDLPHLEAIYSTASPLPSSTFSFVYRTFPQRINLGSISGGTDIISNFGEPCSLLPVHAGEIQCIGLGLAVAVADSLTGKPLHGQDGELVCLKPFPSQPLTFWGPDGEAKYRSAYFERFENVWHHGDFARINPSTGGLIVLGRSDGVLNPSGVRFGSAEIYGLLSKFFSTEIDEALCVGRVKEGTPNEVVCVFVVMHAGKKLEDDLRKRIKTCIRTELSARHVPGVIEECEAGIPKTNNGKKIEIAVKRIISGYNVTPNASVANPEALEWFREWAAKN